MCSTELSRLRVKFGWPTGYFELGVRALLVSVVAVGIAASASAQLDEDCVVAYLNRTARVQADGTWQINNVPANFGPLRARVTCVQDGRTLRGQSARIRIEPSVVTGFDADITLGAVEPIPTTITVSAPRTALSRVDETLQLQVTARFPDGSVADVTAGAEGTSYTVSNPEVAGVEGNGLVTARASGTVIVSAVNEGALGLFRVQVRLGGDSDGDGIPDELEVAQGLDPEDPIDGLLDLDRDGLDNRRELVDLGTEIRNADSDGDGIEDGEEVVSGEDGFVTDPLVADTDGDGIRDALEIASGSDPTDPSSSNLAGALEDLVVSPSEFRLDVNAVQGEGSRQLTVTGQLIDGTSLDLTSTARGTNYLSSDLSVCNFGAEDGRVFGAADGECTVTVSNSDFSDQATITVVNFQPQVTAFLDLSGRARGIDVTVGVAYVAADTGLHLVDAADRAAPVFLETLATGAEAYDVVAAQGLLYVANGAAGLAIYDASDPLAPVLLGELALPGTARDLAVRGDRVLVVDEGFELHVVDAFDPADPSLLGSADLGTASRGGVAFSQDGGLALVTGDSELVVVDLANPELPVERGRLATGGEPRALLVRDEVALVGDRSSGLQVISFADTDAPTMLSSLAREVAGLPEDLALAGEFLVAAERFFVNRVPILNVADPAAPFLAGGVNFDAIDDSNGRGIAADERFVYLVGRRGDSSRLFIGQYRQAPDRAGIPPQVEIVEPAEGASAIGGERLVVVVEARDDFLVEGVDLLVDGAVVSSSETTPHEFVVEIPLGVASVQIDAQAQDQGGNVGEATPLAVAVLPNQPPEVVLTAPEAGTEVAEGEVLTLQAEASDDLRLEAVDFLVNGEVVLSDPRAPYAASVIPPPGDAFTVAARARDTVGNATTTPAVTVSVARAATATITGRIVDAQGDPIEGAVVRGPGSTQATTGPDGFFELGGIPLDRETAVLSVEVGAEGVRTIRRTDPVPLDSGVIDIGGFAFVPRIVLPLFRGQKFVLPDSSVGRVAAGDFDGDGLADVAASLGSTQVATLLGYGDATFQDPLESDLTLVSLREMRGFDMDGDGLDDLVAVAHSTSLVAVALSRGDGHFAVGQRTDLATQAEIHDLALGDFDGDGLGDLSAVDREAGELVLAFGQGAGVLGDLRQVAVGSDAESVAAGDFDGDGRLDLAVGRLEEVRVLLGAGDGTFVEADPIALPASEVAQQLVATDLDSDGLVDLAVGHRSRSLSFGPVHGLTVHRADGAGRFVAVATSLPDEASGVLVVGDLDVDGAPDIVSRGERDLVAWRGRGDGSLEVPVRFRSGLLQRDLSLADLDGDGDDDLIFPSSDISGAHVAVFLNPRPEAPVETAGIPALDLGDPEGELGSQALVLADLDGDGLDDLVATLASGHFGLPGRVAVLAGDAGGSFGAPTLFAAGVDPGDLAIGDVNADGVPDVLVVSEFSDELVVLEGDGTGGLLPEVRVALPPRPTGVAMGDVDGDGDLDAVVGALEGSTADGRVSVLLNDGLGGFALARTLRVDSSPVAVALADLDRDGRLDVVAGDRGTFADPGGFFVLFGNGNGTFRLRREIYGGDIADFVVADLNRDGIPDLAGTPPSSGVASGSLVVQLGLGDRQFAPAELVGNRSASDLVVADVDGDGSLDLVSTFGGSGQGTLAVHLNEGDGRFEHELRFAAGNAGPLVAADLDDDGATDVLVGDADQVALHRNRFPDRDRDGLADLREEELGTDPEDPDTDGDGMSDGFEVRFGLDPLSPADGAEDADADGLDNLGEQMADTDPRNPDTDADGLRDGFEVMFGFDPRLPGDAGDDPDADGLDNMGEQAADADPRDPDTDGDGLRDGFEVDFGFSPTEAGDESLDADADGLENLGEQEAGTDPLRPDTDDDGLEDGDEVTRGTDPTRSDTDGDELSDGEEVLVAGTDPLDVDTDDGGASDGEEVLVDGTDPLDPTDDLVGSGPPVTLPTVLLDAAGGAWDVQRDGSIGVGPLGGLAGAAVTSLRQPVIASFPERERAGSEDEGRELLLGPQAFATLGGEIAWTRKVTALSHVAALRYLEIFENRGSATETIELRIESRLAAGTDVRIAGTSSGDLVAGGEDDYVLLDDADPAAGAPAFLHIFADAFAPLRPGEVIAQDGEDTLTVVFSLELAPGETAILAHFLQTAPDRSIDPGGPIFLGFDFLEGLSFEEQNALRNVSGGGGGPN